MSAKYSLFKRNSVYYIQFLRNGKRVQKSLRAKSRSDALKALTQFQDLIDQPSDSVRLSHFQAEFIKHAQSNFSTGTVEIYQAAFKRLLALVGDVPLSEISPLHCDRYKTERLGTVSPVTVNIELRTLKASFNTAIRWNLLKLNPFSGQPLCAIPDKAPTYLGRDEFNKLISVIKEPWLREAVVFATLTGLRRGEITNLTWNDVDLERRVIVVQSSNTFRTKNGRRRVVPLNQTVEFILKSRQAQGIGDYVFSLNGRKINDGWISHKFKFYVYLCRFKDDSLHFHSLRHTFASWLVQEGVSLYAIKELLGHTDIKTTQVYSHLQVSELHETVNKLIVNPN